MGTAILAWLIAILGLVMIAGGIWGFVILWNSSFLLLEEGRKTEAVEVSTPFRRRRGQSCRGDGAPKVAVGQVCDGSNTVAKWPG
jgi:hypothetical protein